MILQIILRYDVILIQEIRDISGNKGKALGTRLLRKSNCELTVFSKQVSVGVY